MFFDFFDVFATFELYRPLSKHRGMAMTKRGAGVDVLAERPGISIRELVSYLN